MHKDIIFSDIFYKNSGIKFSYEGEGLKYAWLENANKHIPDVIKVKINFIEKYIFIDLISIHACHQFRNKKNSLKLSISGDYIKIPYKVSEKINGLISEFKKTDINISLDENDLIFEISVDTIKDDHLLNSDSNALALLKNNSMSFKTPASNLPLKIIVIGSCCSRSIFRSLPYFNPNYKDFFRVAYTSFHNSLISIMSRPIMGYDYDKFND